MGCAVLPRSELCLVDCEGVSLTMSPVERHLSCSEKMGDPVPALYIPSLLDGCISIIIVKYSPADAAESSDPHECKMVAKALAHVRRVRQQMAHTWKQYSGNADISMIYQWLYVIGSYGGAHALFAQRRGLKSWLERSSACSHLRSADVRVSFHFRQT